jgi:ABC-type branched-subunit amino acid transport system ATPase component
MDSLVVSGLVKRFGGVVALNGVDFRVKAGETRALIGPNGSGKSTLINCVSAIDVWDEGTISVEGTPVVGKNSVVAARRGIARTFQTLRLFDDMSVVENVMVAMHHWRQAGLLSSILGLPRFREDEKRMRADALALLELCGIAGVADRTAATLPYGHRRLVEIARALAIKPRLLLLDEPAAGLNDSETEELANLVKSLGKDTLAIVVVEHNMDFVASVADQVTVLDNGSVIAEGIPEEVRRHPEVLRAYLGSEES